MPAHLRFPLALIAVVAMATALVAQAPAPEDAPEKKFGDFQKLVRGAKEFEGLFRLYLKDDHVYMEIQPHQFNRPLLAPMSIASGLGMGGDTLNMDEQWVLMFRRVGDKIHLIRRNVHFRANPMSPVARAVETTYSDSVLMALRIQALNLMRNAVVIDLNDIFFTNFADLPLGFLDANRTTWHKVKTFPRNIELQVAATFGGGRGGDDSVIDPRGKTVVVHYSLVDLPQDGYQPRYADDRVGYFLTAVKDFTSDNRETPFVRFVNRWRLERVDGSPWKEGAKLVPPRKKIVFWIEKSVPDEYRSAVREGILEWNKAFERIGFKDAIEVRQQESEDFDPEDVNFSTFRWLTHEKGYAIGPSRVNPLTGEIIDADITFDASMVRYYKMGHAVFKQGQGLVEPASLIQEAQRGWSLPRLSTGWNEREPATDPQQEMREHMRLFRAGFCQCGAHKRFELGMAAMAWAARNPGEKVPDELIFQAVKETTMHEVGHTLGLRHNFKASTMLKNEQLHDPTITRKQGLSGSVMDYHPVNVAPKGTKQGDWFTHTIGPYDLWAIEYGYKPLGGGLDVEWTELQKIASRAAAPGLDYGTDEDTLARLDPATNQWDMGADPMKYALDRMLLMEELLKGLADRVVEKGDGYQRARQAFGMLLRQYGDASYLIARHVGGEYVHRDHRDDPNARDPMIPVKAAKQRDALKFLQERVFTDKPFQFPPELLRKLAADRWMHWGNELEVMSAVEYPLNERILRLQKIALGELLDAGTLNRIQNIAWKADKDEKPLQLAEIFEALSKSIWSDLPGGTAGINSSVLRRNLQREHLQRLTEMVLGNRSRGAFVFFSAGGGAPPPDARSLARMHLRDLNARIEQVLNAKKTDLEPTWRAHLEESKERIAKALSAAMQVSE